MNRFRVYIFLVSSFPMFCEAVPLASATIQQPRQVQVFENLARQAIYQGNIQKAVSYYRDALTAHILSESDDEEQFMKLFNQYGETYARIGVFSLKEQWINDENLLKLLANKALNDKNYALAQMVHGLMLFYGEKRFASEKEDIHYSMLRVNPIKPNCHSTNNNLNKSFTEPTKEKCETQRNFYQKIQKHITPELIEYRKFEINFYNKVIGL
ncbi:hypothetical protein [Alkanindiges illinoisensis]|uniref:Tetratricopeptide repeat protein n=1 Tax=Alkanindiges illinoisensis TaxID=197183 RepID=A0A4Y7XEH4_9GAMM|nr:hypothetical protein [Alkanindiges illinoisensis]TEU29309.1 hypothetical protein E2B99_04415 [Alkanindiges illinoisensis]